MNRRTLTTNRRPPAKTTAREETQVPASAAASTDCASVDRDARQQLIAAEAYFLAERRGFTPGCELDDWLAAEAIVEDRMRGTSASGQAESAERVSGPA